MVSSLGPGAKESSHDNIQPVPNRRGPWICLVATAALLLFANGANNVPLAAWLAPVFLLRFVRSQKLRFGLPLAYVLLMVTFAFQFRGMVPLPGIAYGVFLVAWAILMVMPYLVDRLIARKLSDFLGSLAFPAVWAATEFLASRATYGSWGSAAYTQYGNLPLLQLLSVTGLWGITFLMGWFASTCNWIWQAGVVSSAARRGAWLCLGTIAAVMLFGGMRLALIPPSSETVRVASISKQEVTPTPSDALSRAFEGRATTADLATLRRWSSAKDDDLLQRSEGEMKAGAKIVFWGEVNASVLKEDEAELIARGADLASKYHAYLGMALGTLLTKNTPPLENKLVFIQPNGQVAWEYNKVRPVPGPEATMQVRGDGKLKVTNTPYGRVSGIICFDGDFPHVLAQAGALQADIVIDPSNDWRSIDPWHTRMASFRAIEQGFNLVRHTSFGLSSAYDYQGRTLAAMDHYHTTDYAMVSQVPTNGVRTLYSLLGDWFGWLCLGGAVLLTILAVRRKPQAAPS